MSTENMGVGDFGNPNSLALASYLYCHHGCTKQFLLSGNPSLHCTQKLHMPKGQTQINLSAVFWDPDSQTIPHRSVLSRNLVLGGKLEEPRGETGGAKGGNWRSRGGKLEEPRGETGGAEGGNWRSRGGELEEPWG